MLIINGKTIRNTQEQVKANMDASDKLDGDIKAEEDIRLASDTTLSNAIDTEELTRQQADDELQASITKEISDRTKAVNDLSSKVDSTINSSISAISAKVDSNTGSISSLNSSVSALNTTVSSIGNRTTAIEGLFSNGVAKNASNLNGHPDSYFATLSALNTEVSNRENGDNSRIKIANIITSTSSATASTQIYSKGKIDDIVSGLNNTISGKADISTVQTLSATVAKHETSISTLRSTVSTLSDKITNIPTANTPVDIEFTNSQTPPDIFLVNQQGEQVGHGVGFKTINGKSILTTAGAGSSISNNLTIDTGDKLCRYLFRINLSGDDIGSSSITMAITTWYPVEDPLYPGLIGGGEAMMNDILTYSGLPASYPLFVPVPAFFLQCPPANGYYPIQIALSSEDILNSYLILMNPTKGDCTFDTLSSYINTIGAHLTDDRFEVYVLNNGN